MALSCKSLREGNVSPGVDREVGGKRLMEFSPNVLVITKLQGNDE